METRYQNEIVGYNLRMTDIHAAIGRVQLQKLPQMTEKRIENARFLSENLETEYRQLKKQSEYKPHTYYHTQYSVSSGYAGKITENFNSYFNVNSAAIIEKEKPRIINSISALFIIL